MDLPEALVHLAVGFPIIGRGEKRAGDTGLVGIYPGEKETVPLVEVGEHTPQILGGSLLGCCLFGIAEIKGRGEFLRGEGVNEGQELFIGPVGGSNQLGFCGGTAHIFFLLDFHCGVDL